MSTTNHYPVSRRWAFLLLLCIGALTLPALLINLGDHTFIDDEGIRSLVAFEMMESGDYIQTTMNGEAYFKKPPLYNWILAAAFKLKGSVDEWAARIPTVFFLLSFLALIFYAIRKTTGDVTMAFLVAALTLTSGRILFWDSFLGLIDMSFSLTIYGLFVWMYVQYEHKRWFAYFVGAWLIAAIAFLLKGLPAVVFLGLSMTAHLWSQKEWKKLFHPGQFIGGALFLLIVGGYYWLRLEGADPTTVFGTLFTESAQRTPTHHGIGKVLLHLLTFPFEMTYHFLPWSLLLLFLFPLRSLVSRLNHPFVRFNVVMIAANIPIYWISPDVFPRYLLMFVPLFSLVGYQLFTTASLRPKKVFYAFFAGVAILIALASWTPLILPQTRDMAHVLPRTFLLIAFTVLAAIAILRQKDLLLCGLIVQLLTLRLAFDWFVIPDRIANDYGTEVRNDARRIGHAYQNKPLVYLDDITGSPTTWFYLSTARGQITPLAPSPPTPGVAFIVPRFTVLPPGVVIRDSMHIRHMDDRFVLICELPISN
ncbi:MAG: glycosyltransferase family 39 protein [Saprospiraceae bacterium]|nr:glycosyltransferase family 39 protein [Saprospiraceae bacterium]